MISVQTIQISSQWPSVFKSLKWSEGTSIDPSTGRRHQLKSCPNARRFDLKPKHKEAPLMHALFDFGMKSALNDLWDPSELVLDEDIALIRYQAGDEVTPHHDATPINSPDGSRVARYTALMYLGGSELSGGELVFPELGVSLKPSAGTLVVFSSDIVHQVNKVKTGERYVAVRRLWQHDG